jgi:hypothetical protein
MTKDEILSMAKECDLVAGNAEHGIYIMALERFAALVAEKATEQANARQNASWARMCEKMVAAEREACANVCDVLPAPEYVSCDDESMWDVTSLACADAIRARGQKEYRGARLVLTKDGVIQDGWMGDK